MKALERGVELAPHTTLELGGPAAFWLRATSVAEAQEALAWARRGGVPHLVLGGGSNLLVPDAGFDGLVLAVRWRGVTSSSRGEALLLEVAAGEPWDDVVSRAVEAGWQGLECLSGIPGLTGATPVQNVGAYGQEVAEVIEAVEVLDVRDGGVRSWTPQACAFAYRDSVFKREPGRWIVTSVTFRLRSKALAVPRYGELSKALGGAPATPAATREAVLALRRSKSMVLTEGDVNRRSVGSFFTNPVVAAVVADEVVQRARRRGLAEVPRWPQPDGRVKLAAGWLVEQSGVAKGLRRGHVGVSSAHALALVHHGGGTTRELLELAAWVQGQVEAAFGVRLEREAVLVGDEGR